MSRSTVPSMPLPAAMVRAGPRRSRGTPAPARAAATVVLLRPADTSLRGVRPQARDDDGLRRRVRVPRRRRRPATTGRRRSASRLGRSGWASPESEAKAVVGAAARELFEEAGVLLAGPRRRRPHDPVRRQAATVVGGPVWDVSGPTGRPIGCGAARELTMTELLARRGLRLRDDLLLPWARWITPEFEPQALRHLVLRGPAAGGPDGAGRLRGGRPDRCGSARRPPTAWPCCHLRGRC